MEWFLIGLAALIVPVLIWLAVTDIKAAGREDEAWKEMGRWADEGLL